VTKENDEDILSLISEVFKAVTKENVVFKGCDAVIIVVCKYLCSGV
jgi:hypothetical protein